MTHRHSTFLLAFAATTLYGMVLFARQPEQTVIDGVYTEAQALRGEASYAQHCARCHGADLDGVGAAPMLYSSRFLDRWREDSLLTLYDYTAANMPQDAGAKRLPDSTYLDVIAYLLYVNDLPAGTGELTLDRVRHTLLVGPDGPRPLPPSTTVRVVGCLAQAGGTWTLTDASVPARVRQADTTSEAELTLSRNTAPGTATFRLPTLGDDHDAPSLAKQVSRKVQVKGVLNGEGATARVSVLSFEALDQPCSR